MSSSASTDWLVSARFDLLAFGLPAVVALGLVPLGPVLAPSGELPLPLWLIAVLGVDVAHVWSSLYVTYLDREARARHRRLFVWAPVLALSVGALVASASLAWFWTGLAYLAVLHFVRQQYGWVALHHRQDPDLGAFDRRLDVATIYASTLVPIAWWHAHLPRTYSWFLPGDFLTGVIPPRFADAALVFYCALLGAWSARQILRWRSGQAPRPGLSLVVVTTAACWGVGIIATNTDWAFTMTNVLIHGVPYMAFVWLRAPRRRTTEGRGATWSRAALFYGVVLSLAYLEELGWDRLVWHEGAVFFGPAIELDELGVAWATAVFTVPQLTHYLVDGFIWRRPRAEVKAQGAVARSV